MTTPTATRTSNGDLAQLTIAAEKARDQAAEASAKASAAMAQAQLAAERIRLEQDQRFVSWASARVGEANATEKRLSSEVDDARRAFDVAVAAGDSAFVARFLDWAESGARLYHARSHHDNLRGHLHHCRPTEYPAYDASRSTNDSKTLVPGFADALARAAEHAVANRSADVADALQAQLEAALRGEDPAVPDRQGG